MNFSIIDRLHFYDGRDHVIDKERLIKFEIASIVDKFYPSRIIDAATVIDDLGIIHIDYTNIQQWAGEIPDIDKRSTRLFTLWAEDKETKEVKLILRGHFILVPYRFETEALREYYYFHKETPCYPLAIVTGIRTTFTDVGILCNLLDRLKSEIDQNWRKVRQNAIESLDSESELLERYVYSFDKIIYISFLCPSIDRELIKALRQKNFRTTGVLQILASPTPSYSKAMVESHLAEARSIVKGHRR